MKLEDRPETYTPTTHSLDGNDNQITKNSNRKTIDHKMTKKGIYTIQKLGIITIKLYEDKIITFLYLYLSILFRR